MGPLKGIRILDMTSVLMGPYATQTLGDYGADVIKVEAPEGDITRQIAPSRTPGMGAIFLNANRSKRSIVIDLKTAQGRDVLLRLAVTSDVLIYNIRPRAMARLKLDYGSVAAVNPSIIYAGLFGFGQGGCYAAKPAYDDLLQGASGLSDLLARGSDGEPRYVPTALADRVVGLTAVNAILAAIIHRTRTGIGQKIDVPMFEVMTSFVLSDHLGGLTFDPPLDRGGYARQLSPHRRPFRTSDGFISAIIYNDKHWQSFFDLTGRCDLRADSRFVTFAARLTHVDEVYAELAGIFRTRTSAEWLQALEVADIPAGPVHDLESILDDPHLNDVDFFSVVNHPTEGAIRTMCVPVSWSETPAAPERHAPALGEQTDEILREVGYTESEISRLMNEGAVRVSAQAVV